MKFQELKNNIFYCGLNDAEREVFDELIPLEHTLKIYEKYKGEKELNIVEEGHNSQRKRNIIDKVIQFFIKHLIDTNEEEKN